MQLPMIHLNGDSQDSLIEQQANVLAALRGAEEAIRAATPHGRNYHPLGPDAYQAAVREHRARQAALEALVREYHDLTVAISRIGH